MKKLNKETKKILNFNWNVRLKLCAEGSRLCAEGNKLYAEGSKLWAETILEFCGNIKLEWKNWKDNKGYECHLETGDVFKP